MEITYVNTYSIGFNIVIRKVDNYVQYILNNFGSNLNAGDYISGFTLHSGNVPDVVFDNVDTWTL